MTQLIQLADTLHTILALVILGAGLGALWVLLRDRRKGKR